MTSPSESSSGMNSSRRQRRRTKNFLGSAIADYLKTRPGFEVKSVRLDDPDQGITDELLDRTDVVIWWGHVRHRDVKPEVGKKIVDRIVAGKLSLIALHSAHWSQPFVQAMQERTREDALKSIPEKDRIGKIRIHHADPLHERQARFAADAAHRGREKRRWHRDGDRSHARLHFPVVARRWKTEPRQDAAARSSDRGGNPEGVRRCANGNVQRAIPRADARCGHLRGNTGIWASISAAVVCGTLARERSSTFGRDTSSIRCISRKSR